MNKKSKEQRFLAGLVAVTVVAVVILAALVGCEPDKPEPRAVRERICFICRTADNQIRNGYDLIFYSDDGSTETATLSGDTGNLSLDGTLTVGGVAQTGAVTYGEVTTVISGTWITHSIGTTPTMMALTASSDFTVTIGPYILNMHEITAVVGMGDGVATSVYWLAGK